VAEIMMMLVFWVVMPCFGETYWPCLQPCKSTWHYNQKANSDKAYSCLLYVYHLEKKDPILKFPRIQ
jgi:hypothetical protein